ncbi:TetR/AcrR family transcriptional regulator [Ilumatobacter sp.]|uniref:TetR/AcrR family transcriptional regulator n=1 Tax=Ilumatobacter sp. TaxID=1967498 RepID=UPI003C3B4B90
MSETAPTATRSTRGRPRDAGRDRAILDAARTVIAERGFTGASMDAIAQTAGVGKDTLYRRWSSKVQLVRHLLTVLADEGIPSRPPDPDPRFGLFIFLQDLVRLNTRSDFGAVVAGVIGESARNPQLADVFHSFWAERRRSSADLVRDVVGPEASADDIDRHVDQIVGPVYYRLLLSGDEITDEYLWDLVATLPWPDDPDRT